MRPSEDMDKLVKNLRYKASAETHDRILGNVMRALDESQRQKTGAGAPDIWRKIMRSPVTKLAAAAVIIIAASIGLNQIISTTPAFAEIIRPLLTAQTATFKMTMALENGPTQNFDCMFMEPMHMRQISSDAIVISNLQEGKILTLMPEQKKAMVMEMENMPENEDQSELNMFHGIRKHIQEAQETEDESVSFLGEKEINGMKTIGYHVQRLGVDITVWADPKTKLPVQMENKMGPVSYTMTDIVFNVE